MIPKTTGTRINATTGVNRLLKIKYMNTAIMTNPRPMSISAPLASDCLDRPSGPDNYRHPAERNAPGRSGPRRCVPNENGTAADRPDLTRTCPGTATLSSARSINVKSWAASRPATMSTRANYRAGIVQPNLFWAPTKPHPQTWPCRIWDLQAGNYHDLDRRTVRSSRNWSQTAECPPGSPDPGNL